MDWLATIAGFVLMLLGVAALGHWWTRQDELLLRTLQENREAEEEKRGREQRLQMEELERKYEENIRKIRNQGRG